jgi:hypothetical protein
MGSSRFSTVNRGEAAFKFILSEKQNDEKVDVISFL